MARQWVVLGGAATGEVVNRQGQPTGARAMLQPSDDYWGLDMGTCFDLLRRLGVVGAELEARTDEQGRWRLEGLIGGAEYEVWVAGPEGKLYDRDTIFTAEPGQTVDVGTSRIGEQ